MYRPCAVADTGVPDQEVLCGNRAGDECARGAERIRCRPGADVPDRVWEPVVEASCVYAVFSWWFAGDKVTANATHASMRMVNKSGDVGRCEIASPMAWVERRPQ